MQRCLQLVNLCMHSRFYKNYGFLCLSRSIVKNLVQELLIIDIKYIYLYIYYVCAVFRPLFIEIYCTCTRIKFVFLFNSSIGLNVVFQFKIVYIFTFWGKQFSTSWGALQFLPQVCCFLLGTKLI